MTKFMKIPHWAFLLWLAPATVLATPYIDASPANPLFGDVLQATTESLTITVTNVGDTNDLNITSISTINLPFAMGTDNCSTQTLAVDANCTFTIDYTPPGIGDDGDTVTIFSNDPDEPTLQLPLEGKGVATPTNRAPTSPVLLTPADEAFGINSASIDFIWENSIDPEGNPLTYTINICTNNGFSIGCITPIVIAKTSTLFMFAAIGGSSSFMLLGLVAPLRNKKQKIAVTSALIFASLLLTSCGGGGGGGGEANFEPGAGNSGKRITSLTMGTTYYWKVTVSDGTTPVDSEIRSFTTSPP